jgi:2-hydroxy-3-oxopropionate reductase
MIDRNFVPGGFNKNQLKDLNAALKVAGDLGLRLPLAERVRELFTALATSGKEELDHSALILQIEAMQA